MAYAVCVTLQVKPDCTDAFMDLMLTNSQISLSKEEGCLQFDVCSDPDQPNVVFLYEIYSSRDAFMLHLNSDHFKTFDQESNSLIEQKTVNTFRVVQ